MRRANDPDRRLPTVHAGVTEGLRSGGGTRGDELTMTGVQRGRLLDTTAAPATGERAYEIVHTRTLRIEQVLSGSLEPVGYLQAEDEWALVLDGAATLEIEGEQIELGPGEWVFLPAGTPHRLLRADPGTNWVTVRV
jgi:cupin 2 domain-containing protein